MTETAKKFLNISIWVSIILFALRCWISWETLTQLVNANIIAEFGYSLFAYAGEAIGIAALFMAGFNKFLWRWKPINIITGRMPILSKKYKGTIKFEYEGKKQTRILEMMIEQSFLNVSVRIKTSESSSNSLTAIIETVDSERQLIYTYINVPRAEIQNRSAVHYGTAMIRVDDPKCLTGNYYTMRLSRGSMQLNAE